MLSEAFLGLGANLGDRAANIERAVEMLRKVCRRVEVSSLYETDAKGFALQPAFLNAVCRVWSGLDPYELLAAIKRIEGAAARERVFVNAPRTLDVDVLLYGRLVVETPVLTLPHPRMARRAFVLVPLTEIAPDAFHPVHRVTTAALLSRLGPDGERIRLFPRAGSRPAPASKPAPTRCWGASYLSRR